ncbi:MAG: PIN domain-containing protein [Hyphomicrobiales bacterium]|nr:PIN domain-containing protein [Hyphomicrobiales bacterium]
MIVPYFLDTNILIYAALPRKGEEVKRRRAAELIDAAVFGTSGQVLQEFYWQTTRKSSPALPFDEAFEWVEMLEEQPFAAVDSSLVKTGIEISRRYKISYWDGAIIAAAESLGAPIVYSEDLNDGQKYGDIQVINPFKNMQSFGGFHEDAQRQLK